MSKTNEPTAVQSQALEIARELIAAGIPVFAAAPCPENCKTPGHSRMEFHLPRDWQKIPPSEAHLNRWKPGWALAAVSGRAADFIDVDDHHGGDVSWKTIQQSGGAPRVFGMQRTPSGGRHYMISPLRERGANGFLPGLDYQGGDADGEGRCFVWIAPTVKRSKNVADRLEDGSFPLGEYRWEERPDTEMLGEFAGSDDSGTHISDLLAAHRSPAPEAMLEPVVPAEGAVAAPAPSLADDPFVTSSQVNVVAATGMARRFTTDGAWAFVQPALKDLREATIGSIEEMANRAAAQLSHFVPEFMTAEDGYAILLGELAHTAYDPNGPSGWTAEKFIPVLDGSRPLRDNWKAQKIESGSLTERVAETEAHSDAVEKMLEELLSAEEVAEREPPQPLVKGLLNLDSESWIIGEPGSKKSFVATDIAGHVALGKPWQGLKVTQGKVIMIVAEGAGGMGPRLKAFAQEHQEALPPKPIFSILPRPVQSADASAWRVLVEVCRRMQPALVVIDTQARVTVGLEENSAKEMGVYVNAVSAIREATGACVLTVHHTGRKGGDARGSSAIDGAQTTELKVESSTGKLAGKLFTEKQKDIEPMKPLSLVFVKHVVGTDADGAPITSLALAGDAYKAASGTESPEDAEALVVQLTEPGAWLEPYAPARAVLQRRILQTMHMLGGTVGRTQAEYKRAVVEHWYPKPKKLTEADWGKAWTAVVGRTAELDGMADEPLVVGQGGRYRLSTLLSED